MAATKKNNKKKKSAKKAKKAQSQSQANAPGGSSDIAQEAGEDISETGVEINTTGLDSSPADLNVTRSTEAQTFGKENNPISMENGMNAINAINAEEITPLGIQGNKSIELEEQSELQQEYILDTNDNSIPDQPIEVSVEDQTPVLEADSETPGNATTEMKNGDSEIIQDQTKGNSFSAPENRRDQEIIVDPITPKENDKLHEATDIEEKLLETITHELEVEKPEKKSIEGYAPWNNGDEQRESMPWDNEEEKEKGETMPWDNEAEEKSETMPWDNEAEEKGETMPWDNQVHQNSIEVPIIGSCTTEDITTEITSPEVKVQYPLEDSNQENSKQKASIPLDNEATNVPNVEESISRNNDQLKHEENMLWDAEKMPTEQMLLDDSPAPVLQEKEEPMPWDNNQLNISNSEENIPWDAEKNPGEQKPSDDSQTPVLQEKDESMPWEKPETNKEMNTNLNDEQHGEINDFIIENNQSTQDDTNSIEESTRMDEQVGIGNIIEQKVMPWEEGSNVEDKLNISDTTTDKVNEDDLFLNDLAQKVQQKENESKDKFHFLEEDDEILLDDIMDDDLLDDNSLEQANDTSQFSSNQTVLITPAKKASKYQPAPLIPPSNTFIPTQRTSLVQPHIIPAVNTLVPVNKKNIENAFHSQKLADSLKIEKQKNDAYDFPSDLLAKHSPLANVKSQTQSVYTRLETEAQNQQQNALEFAPPPPPPISISRRSSHITPISSPLVRPSSLSSQTSSMNPYAKPVIATGNMPLPRQSFFSELPVSSNIKNTNNLHLKNPYEAIETSPSFSNTSLDGIKPKNRYSASIGSDSSKLSSPKPPAMNIKTNPYGPQINQQSTVSLRANSLAVKSMKPSNPYAPPEAGGHLRTPSANIPTPAEVKPNVVPVPIKSPISMISPQKSSFRLKPAYPGQAQEQQMMPPNAKLIQNQQPLSFPLPSVQHQYPEQQQQPFIANNSQAQFAPPSNVGGRYAPHSQTQMKQNTMQFPVQKLSNTPQLRSVSKYSKPPATSINDMYGSNIVTSNATSMHSRRKSVLPPAPGFTGKINVADAVNFTPAPVVINPENLVRRQWPLFSFSAANNVLSMIPSSDGYGHSITNIKISDISTVIKQEPLYALFPGPLSKGKSKKKDISKWIADKIESLNSSDDILMDCRLMTWNILKVMVDYVDKPNDFVKNREYIQALTKVLNPSLIVSDENSNNIDIVAISRLSQGFNQNKNFNSHKVDIQGLSKIHDLLESGNKKSALELALSEGDWAMALVISHIMGLSAFNQIIKLYASVTFGNNDALGQDLSFFIQSTTHEGISLDQMIGRESWLVTNYKTVIPFILLNNPDPGNFLLQLGDLLLKSGNIEYSKLTFLLSGLPLIPKNLSHLPSSIDAMIIDEIYEYILLSSGNVPQTFANGFPHMIPVKIRHAGFLIDFGYSAEAKKYSDFTQSLISSKQLFCDHTTILAQQQISERLAQITNFGSGWLGSKLSKPKLDKVWTTLDKSFNKFVSGEEISKLEQKPDGVFSKFISPDISRVGSIQDLSDIHQNGQIKPLANPYARIERRSTTADFTNLPPISSNVPISQSNISNNVHASLSSSVSLQNFHRENEKDNLYKPRMNRPLDSSVSGVKIEKKEHDDSAYPVSRTGSVLEMSGLQPHIPRNPAINTYSTSEMPSPARRPSQYLPPVAANTSIHHSVILDKVDSAPLQKQSSPSSPHVPYIPYVPPSASIPPVPHSPVTSAADAPVVPFASPIPSAPSAARFSPLESNGSTDLVDTAQHLSNSPSAAISISHTPTTGNTEMNGLPPVAFPSKQPMRTRNLYAPTASQKGPRALKKPAKSPYAPANIVDNVPEHNPFNDMDIPENLGGYDIYTLGGYHVPPPSQKPAEDIKLDDDQSQEETNIQNPDIEVEDKETSCSIDERLEDEWPQIDDDISMRNSEKNMPNPPNFKNGADHLKSMFNPPTGQFSNGNSLHKAISPIYQVTDQKKFYAQDTGEYYDDVVDEDDEDDDDKKKEQDRKKKDDDRKQQEKLREKEREKENKKKDETKKKESQAATNKNENGSWFGWLGKNKGDKPAPIKAKLGEKSAFYYDEDLKRWINGKASAEEQTANVPPPPPVKKASTSGPPSVASSTPVSSEPPTASPFSSSGGPSQSQQRIGNLKKDNINDLLSMASPSSTRKSKRGPRRGYVDVMAQQK